MNRREAERVIRQEHLTSCSFFASRPDASDELVIRDVSGRYVVYATNERAAKITEGERIFDREAEALDCFLRRLRALNHYRNSR